MRPRQLLQLEGALVLASSLWAYHWFAGRWLLLALLFLAPDISIAGYAINVRVGALSYNAVHTYVGPFLLGAYALRTHQHTTLLIALIWLSHIGFDRLLGYGLKYPTQFQDTHLNPRRHTLQLGNGAGAVPLDAASATFR